MRLVLFILLCAGLSFSAQAYSRYQPKKMKIKSEKTEKIKVKVWQKRVFPGLVGGVCESEGYFQSCFQVVPKECETVAKEQLNLCRANLRIPKSFKSDQEAVYWSQKIGECLGGRLEKTWAMRKVGKAKCRQVEAWL